MDLHDEAKKLQEEARKVFEKTVGFLKTVPGKIDDRVRRTAEISALKLEILGVRRTLDDAYRELGRSVHDLIRLQGQVTADEIPLAVEKVQSLEAKIAERERRIAKLELEMDRAEDRARAARGAAKGTARTASDEQASAQETPSRKAASRKAASKKAASKKTPSKKAASKKTPSKKAASKKTPSKKTASRKTASRKTASKKTVPKKASSRKPSSK